MISLYTKVPNTRRKKAKSSPQLKVSCLVARLMTQMKRVRQVSMVDRYAADAYFVMLTPVALKLEIDKIIPIDIQRSAGYVASYLNASAESSIFPASPQIPLVVHSIFWKIGRIIAK